MINLPDDILYFLAKLMVQTDEGVIDLIRLRSTCKKYYNDKYLLNIIEGSNSYTNIKHDISIGYYMAKINTYDFRIKNFTRIKCDSTHYLHSCQMSNCREPLNSTSRIYDLVLPYDYLPIMLNYLNNKRSSIKCDITIGWCKFNVGIKLGIFKAALALENFFQEQNMLIN